MASITNLTYKLLSVKHLCAVRNLIEEHFTSTFSLGVYLNWTKEDSIPAYYPRIESFLKQGNSLGAFSDIDAKLRGVFINVEHDDNEKIKYDETLHISEKTDTINRVENIFLTSIYFESSFAILPVNVLNNIYVHMCKAHGGNWSKSII
ncbi:uncharacterized protein LOC144411799 [Styela clava]